MIGVTLRESRGVQNMVSDIEIAQIESQPFHILVPTDYVAEITEDDDQSFGSSKLKPQTFKIFKGQDLASLLRLRRASLWKSALQEFLSLIREFDPSQPLSPRHRKLQGWLSHGTSRARDICAFLLYCLLYASDEKKLALSTVLNYCIQDGLISWDASTKGDEMLDVLIDAGLLRRFDGGVMLPDVSKDFAAKMLLSELDAFGLFMGTDSCPLFKPHGQSLSCSADQIITAVGSREPLPEMDWENLQMAFFMNSDLSEFPRMPNCTNLSMLFLQRNPDLQALPGCFFHYMRSLRILDVSGTRITSLAFVSPLVSLQRLVAKDCKRLTRLPSQEAKLNHIELLQVGGSRILELPKHRGRLTSLKCLEVSLHGPSCSGEYDLLPDELISPGTISKLTSLTTLAIWVRPGDERWIEDMDSVVLDICMLKNLTSLCLHFPEMEHLEVFLAESLSWGTLSSTKFNFIVGHDVVHNPWLFPENMEFEYSQQDRCLRYVNGQTVPSALVDVLAHSTAFCLHHHVKARSLSELEAENMNWLKLCFVRGCPRLKTIIDGSGEGPILPKLEVLSINCLGSCMSLWRSSLSSGSFARLKHLQVEECPRLKSLLTSSMCRYVVQLEKLVVENCQAMEELISDDNSVKPDDVLLPNLKTLTLRNLRRLVRIWPGSWPCIQHLAVYHVPNLTNLKMGSNFELTRSVVVIEARTFWWDELGWDNYDLFMGMMDRFKQSPEELFYGSLIRRMLSARTR